MANASKSSKLLGKILLDEYISISSPLFNTINTSGVNLDTINCLRPFRLLFITTEKDSKILSLLFFSIPRLRNTLLFSNRLF